MEGDRETVHSSWSEKGGKGLAWAGRAIRRELLEFRFDYPVEIVPEAGGSHSLHYYIFSDRLFLDDLKFDQNGVAMKRYRSHGSQYNPLFVAWWGLFNLEQYLREKNDRFLQQFLIQVDWLKANVVIRDDGAVVWPCYFDWQEGFCLLKAPWISAMYQGVVISTLVRAYRVTGDKGLIALCEQGARVFEKSIEDGGVRTIEEGRVLYEEYPGYPLARVLDGFLISLLGLYDLAVETGRPDVRRLFEQGIQGLRQTLGYWDYRGKWSWYGARAYLCPPHYHRLNSVLLTVLGSLTGDTMLKRYAEQWDVRNLSVMDKVEIFLVFTVTKNWARLRLPRN